MYYRRIRKTRTRNTSFKRQVSNIGPGRFRGSTGVLRSRFFKKGVLKMTFPCDCCGLCCQNLHRSPLYADLHYGDGICRHFNRKTNKCKIYDTRPDKCNIDIFYEKYFSDQMTKAEFYELNIAACNKLKSEYKKRSQRE